MPIGTLTNTGTINGSKEHTYIQFILVGGGNKNFGGQVIKKNARVKSHTKLTISIGAGNNEGCESSIKWESTDNTDAQITSEFGFETLEDNNWIRQNIIAIGGEENYLPDSITGEEVIYGDNKNAPGTCAVKILSEDCDRAIIQGNPTITVDGDHKVLVWKQPGTIQVA
tara:strand:+ start:1092 stop:1598 length:507 start_codon:yes stop_codon:yes gene_type:complete